MKSKHCKSIDIELARRLDKEEYATQQRVQQYVTEGYYALKAYEESSNCPVCGSKTLSLMSKSGECEQYVCKRCRGKCKMAYSKPGVLLAYNNGG